MSSRAANFFRNMSLVSFSLFHAPELIAKRHFTGLNTTVTLQAHEGSLPGLPDIGKALSGIQVNVRVPKLGAPGEGHGDDEDDDDEGSPHFIKDATVLPPFIYLRFHQEYSC